VTKDLKERSAAKKRKMRKEGLSRQAEEVHHEEHEGHEGEEVAYSDKRLKREISRQEAQNAQKGFDFLLMRLLRIFAADIFSHLLSSWSSRPSW